MATFSELRCPGKFEEEGDLNLVSLKWKAWLEEFESYADCKDIPNLANDGTHDADYKTKRTKRRALLLYLAGPQVRAVFKDLPDKGNADDYTAAVNALNTHYIVAPNPTFQRHQFRKLVQNSDETVAKFVSRLRISAEGCNYDNVNTEIKDQVVSTCRSTALRTKLLERGADLDLPRLLEIAANMEAVEKQTREMQIGASQVQVNRVGSRKTESQSTSFTPKSEIECYRCGKTGHKGTDLHCPARGKICRKCGKVDHFEIRCRSKITDTAARGSHNYSNARGRHGRGSHSSRGRGRNVNQVTTASVNDSEIESQYAFACKSSVQNKSNKVELCVGKVYMTFLVDSGSDCNLIDRDLWETAKQQNIVCTSRKVSKNI